MRQSVLRKDPNRSRSRTGSRTSSGTGRSRQPAKKGPAGSRRGPDSDFVLYVEGARDREILRCWARRAEPGLSRCIEDNTVILGGRRIAKTQEDFRKRGGAGVGLTGLVVLDRDDHAAEHEIAHVASDEHGLEVFIWSLRHIESYLLVPAALKRLLRVPVDDPRVELALAVHLAGPVAGEAADSGSLHAKRILGAGGSLSEALGTELRAGEIARAMRSEDLHEDVWALFERIGRLSGRVAPGPEVVIRSTPSDE